MSAEIVVGACYRNPETGVMVRVLLCERDDDTGCVYRTAALSGAGIGYYDEHVLAGWERVAEPQPAAVAPTAPATIVVQRSRLRAFGHRVARLAEVRGLEIDDASSPHMLVVRVTFYVREDDSPLVAVVRGENLDEAFAHAEKLLREAVEVAS